MQRLKLDAPGVDNVIRTVMASRVRRCCSAVMPYGHRVTVVIAGDVESAVGLVQEVLAGLETSEDPSRRHRRAFNELYRMNQRLVRQRRADAKIVANLKAEIARLRRFQPETSTDRSDATDQTDQTNEQCEQTPAAAVTR